MVGGTVGAGAAVDGDVVVAADGQIDGLCFSSDRRYLLACSNNELLVWSGGRVRVLLGRVPADQGGVGGPSSFAGAGWRPPPASLAATTHIDGPPHQFVAATASSVSVWQVTAGKPTVLQYQYKSGAPKPQRPFVAAQPLPSIDLEHLLTVDVPGGCSCLAMLSDTLFVVASATDDHLHVLNFDGLLLCSVAMLGGGSNVARRRPSPPVPVVHLSRSAYGALSVVFEDGRAAVMHQSSLLRRIRQHDRDSASSDDDAARAAPQPLDAAELVFLDRVHLKKHGGATVIAFNRVHKLISVGCASGEVLVFDARPQSRPQAPSTGGVGLGAATGVTAAPFAKRKGKGRRGRRAAGAAAAATVTATTATTTNDEIHFPFLRLFCLAHWDISTDVTGPVSCLEWSPDQTVLCVGFDRRGWCIFSLYGCRLMSTIPQIAAAAVATAAAVAPSNPPTSPPPGGGGAGAAAPQHRSASSATPPPPATSKSMTDGGGDSSGELAPHGVSAVTWAASGYDVCFAENWPDPSELMYGPLHRDLVRPGRPVCAFRQLGFAKKASASSAGDNLILLGDDRLYMLQWPRPPPPSAAVVLSRQQHFSHHHHHPHQHRQTDGGGQWHRPGVDTRLHQLPDPMAAAAATASETWRHLPYPSVYLKDNWPIAHLAVSRCGTQLVVAGRHGAALYNRGTKRWKLFGDANEEKALHCHAVCWFGRDVVVFVNAVPVAVGGVSEHSFQPSAHAAAHRYEVLFYPRSHLSSSSLLGSFQLPAGREPRFIDCNERYLVLFTHDSFFYQYLMIPHWQDGDHLVRIDLQLVHQVSMAAIASEPVMVNLLPLSATGSPAPGEPARSAHHTRCLLLSAAGTLSLANPETCQLIPLARDVEQFWLNVRSNESTMGSILCAHGRTGLQIWFPFAASNFDVPGVGADVPAGGGAPRILNQSAKYNGGTESMPLMRRDVALDFDKDVYPTGFVPDLGLVVGLSMGFDSATGLADLPRFQLQTKSHPFLHSVLGHLLSAGGSQIERAYQVAVEFSSAPQFLHSLELLLHETLDRNSSGNGPTEEDKDQEEEEEEDDDDDDDGDGDAEAFDERDAVEAGAVERGYRPATNSGGYLYGLNLRQRRQSEVELGRATRATRALTLDGDDDPNFRERSKSVEPDAMHLSEARRRNPQSLSRKQRTDDELLGEVVRFLSRFTEEFPSIVVRCARKTDSTYWKRLFLWVGDPALLFNRCVDRGHIHIAASYLLVLQVINGPFAARAAAIQLLDLALARDDVELAGDLVRFIEPSLALPDDNDDELVDTEGDWAWAKTEMLLARYARKLLSRVNLAGLLHFSRAVRHDLRPWLRRERMRAARIHDWDLSLRLLHAQFSVPYPSRWSKPCPLLARPKPALCRFVWAPDVVADKTRRRSDDVNGDRADSDTDLASSMDDDMSGGGGGPGGSSGGPAGLRKTIRRTSLYDDGSGETSGGGGRRPNPHRPAAQTAPPVDGSFWPDLSFLLGEFIENDCLEIGVLIGLVLLNVNVVEQICQENISRVNHPFFRLLNVQQAEGYIIFRQVLFNRLQKK